MTTPCGRDTSKYRDFWLCEKNLLKIEKHRIYGEDMNGFAVRMIGNVYRALDEGTVSFSRSLMPKHGKRELPTSHIFRRQLPDWVIEREAAMMHNHQIRKSCHLYQRLLTLARFLPVQKIDTVEKLMAAIHAKLEQNLFEKAIAIQPFAVELEPVCDRLTYTNLLIDAEAQGFIKMKRNYGEGIYPEFLFNLEGYPICKRRVLLLVTNKKRRGYREKATTRKAKQDSINAAKRP